MTSDDSGASAPPAVPSVGDLFAEVDENRSSVRNPTEGDTVGDLRLTRRVGEGSMASVFQAERIATGEHLAVKVLRAELCHNLDIMRRFDKEVLVAKHVSHPNLVEITDVVHSEEFPPILIMELLEGEDLGTVVELQGPFPPQQAAGIAAQISGALQALHEKHIVHRDLKPENIFLVRSPDGDLPTVKLLDFGLVKFMYGGDAFFQTHPDITLGTPAFMAPEQFHTPSVNHLADIYGVGAVLYEMLTGRAPFEANSFAEGYQKVMHDEVVPPSKRLPPDQADAFPAGLDAIVLRCLARPPAERIQDAATLGQLFEQVQRGEAPALPGPSAGRSHRLWIGLGVALVMLLLAGVAYLLWSG